MTTMTQPTQQTIANIWSELQRLNVPMRGWWHEPQIALGCPDSSFGMEVAKEALTDWDADWLIFEFDIRHGWTMTSQCEPGPGSTVALDIPDPFDVPAVAEHLRKVVVGEIDEFRRVATR
jgi:hypothetical protein